MEKVNFLVASSQHGGGGYFGGGRIPIARGQKWLCFGHFSRGSFLVGSLKNEILGFDENLAVVLVSDLQQCVRLQLPPKRLCANGTRER